MHYLGVDLGTSSIKILLADANGTIIDSESKEYPISYPAENCSEQNPDDWYNALVAVVTALGLRQDLSQIEGVSFSGQMHGLVLLDEHDRVIRPAILWNDNRTTRECDYLNNTIGKENLVNWTGNIAFTGFTAPKVLWVRNNEPENFRRIRKIMLPKDYLAYKMSGVFCSDVSDNSGTLYFDVENGCWSKPMLDILGISEQQLPRVFQSFEAVGTVDTAFARATGMSVRTRVIAGGGDQAVGAVGTGTVGDGRLSISLGTSGVVFASNASYCRVESGAMHSFRHADGRFHMMGVMLSAAGSNDWWVKSVLRESNYAAVDAGAAAARADGLYFLPYLTGERSPINDPAARGAFFGLTAAHTRDDLSRAVLEGISFGLLDCYRSMLEAGASAQYARVIGGGAKSPPWLQMLSDVLGLELRTINTAEGGGLGAVILAMTGCGRFASVEEGCAALIRDVKVYRPDPAETARYGKKFATFKQLYERLKGLA
jgi:xylulokinase